jgi:signal transduction histidine kinase
MLVEMRDVESIKPYPDNPRRNDAAVEAVARSIAAYGFRQCLVVDENGVIVVGHTRWKAAKLLGLKEVPVHVARGLTPTQLRAYRLADNQTATIATWDDDLLVAELTKLQEAVANELKNPLTSIKGLVGLAELDPSRAAERLAVLQKEICRMQLILEDHLSFARPLTPLVAERVDVYAVVVWVVWLHGAIAREKQLRFDLSNVERVEISGEVRKLRQMLMHLVINAIEASTRGGTVEIAVRRDGDRVHIAVLDGGAGIDPCLLAMACDAGVTTKEHGSGLGLTIVRGLAEQHGGTLALHNRDGGGLAAEIDLPLEGAAL